MYKKFIYRTARNDFTFVLWQFLTAKVRIYTSVNSLSEERVHVEDNHNYYKKSPEGSGNCRLC